MAEQENWERLIAGLRTGDQRSARLLWEEYAPNIQRIVENRWAPWLAQREDPEDVVQSIFRTFFRRVQAGEFEFADRRELFLLLFGITRRKVAKRARHGEAGCRDARRDIQTGTTPWTDAGASPAAIDRSPTPAEATEAAESTDELRKAIGGLPERQCEVVQHRLEGKSTTEIAEALGITDRMVRKYLQRAIASLRNRLSEE